MCFSFEYSVDLFLCGSLDLDLVVLATQVINGFKSFNFVFLAKSSEFYLYLTRVRGGHKSPEYAVDRPIFIFARRHIQTKK